MKGCLGLCFEALVLSLTIDQPHIRAIEAHVGFVEVLLAGQAGQRQSRHAHSLKPQHLQIAERCMAELASLCTQAFQLVFVTPKAIIPTLMH